MTARYLSGDLDVDRVDGQQRFTDRSRNAEQNKILKTAAFRAGEPAFSGDLATLPKGRVIQVHSLYCSVRYNGRDILCVKRKTLERISDSAIIVGDEVLFRPVALESRPPDAPPSVDSPDGVIEAVEPRRTVITRADSFKALTQQPIIANAQQMLIVVALAEPRPKWGLVDRMIIAAQAGGLTPLLCLNKVDLRTDHADSDAVLGHYATVLNIPVFRSSAQDGVGIDSLRERMTGSVTALAGHSGVGKSSLINVISPGMNLRVGAISGYTDKGRHTTTSARYFDLPGGGAVIDTPGVKLFGLWNVTRDTLADYFRDVEADTAPEWRRESFARIRDSLAE